MNQREALMDLLAVSEEEAEAMLVDMGEDPDLELEPQAATGETVAQQVASDTCVEHDVFCCRACFDMTPVRS